MINSYPSSVSTQYGDQIKSIRSELILLLILFLGLFLRIYHLGNESIWLDEAFSIKLANSGLLDILKGSIKDTHPPLYHLLLHYWIHLFGTTEFSTRFLSVIFGSLSILMIYKVGSLAFDKETGMLSVIILTLSTFNIYYSQEARMYSLLLLLTLLSIYFFIKLFNNRSMFVLAGFILSSILLMYTHIYGIFIIIAENVYIFTILLLTKENYKLNFKKWIFIQLVLVTLFFPWIVILIRQILLAQTGNKTGWILEPSIHSIIKSFELYAGSNLLLFIFIILSFFSIANHKKSSEKKNREISNNLSTEDNPAYIQFPNFNKIFLLLIWLLIPILIPFLISKISAPIYYYRYTIEVSPAFYLLTAKGITNINYKYLKYGLIGTVIFFSFVQIWEYNSVIKKERWREVVTYLNLNTNKDDFLLFNAGYTRLPFSYYSKRNDLIKMSFPEKTRDVNEKNIKDLGKILNDHNRIWFIKAHSGDPEDLIRKTLSKTYNLLYHKKYIYIPYASDKKDNSIEVCLYMKNINYDKPIENSLTFRNN